MMVVELMASIPPRKIQSICFHPKRCPTTMPSDIMQKMMVQAAMTGAAPILRIFLKEKSSPREKRRNITPILAHISMFSASTTERV